MNGRARRGGRRARLGSLLAVLLAAACAFVQVTLVAPSAEARRRSASRRAPRLTPAQRRQIQRWHQRPTTSAVRTWETQEIPPLVFHPIHAREPVRLAPATSTGGFDAEDATTAEAAWVSRDGTTHAVHPRLLELVYLATKQFRTPWVVVVSGYRDGRATSRHSQGRAIDFVLPGVSDRRLAAWLRPQGFVGVGIYPTSGFVHLDVRSRSYFWSDSSGPDQPNRERRILPELGPRYDAAARRRGQEPTEDLHEGDEGAGDGG